jgi:hypothetical protein
MSLETAQKAIIAILYVFTPKYSLQESVYNS